MESRRWYGAVLLLLMTVGSSRQAMAQTDEEYFQTFPFNFSNPGARSSAMGGAFIGVADDASAAVANPAGLTNLTRRQFYIEYKNLYAPIAQLSHLDSFYTGDGALVGPHVSLPGFINFAVPVNDRMTIAVSSHQFLSYKNSLTLSARQAYRPPSPPLFPAVDASVDFTGFSFSGAVGMMVNPKLRVGVAGSVNHLGADVDAIRSPFFDTNGVMTTARIPSTQIHDTSLALGMTAGLLVQVNDALSLGVMYALEPHFAVRETIKSCARGTACVGAYPSKGDSSWQVPINTPSRTGAGLSYRVASRVLTAVDVQYVQYSDLVADQQLVLFRDQQSFRSIAGASDGYVTGFTVPDRSLFTIANGLDLHGGVELNVVRGPNPIFVRYGVSRTAPHAVQYKPCPNNIHEASFGECDLVSQYYFAPNFAALQVTASDPNSRIRLRQSDLGVSLGGGIVIGNRTQIDAAFLRTSYRRQEFVLSSAIRF
jgi:long-subunit fatty acid transport protein